MADLHEGRPPTAPTSPNAAAPERLAQLGDHLLLQRVGEGGMGEVWLAEQQRPVRRKVALKILKAGGSSRELHARFESERQALALMSHPNVAGIHDAGLSEDGRPWFAMELLDGPPITAFCDERRLSLRERLELFCQVCAGVEHAHQRGLLHRDLKPANILVTEVDGRGLPKVIDFGIAKATGFRLTKETLLTELGVMIGTPEYMSPEQAAGAATDVDTRTDVYSLGVVLYELLTASVPLSVDEAQRRDLAAVQKMIREQEPARPSTRVRRAEAGGAALRALNDRASWRQALAGDLDWILLTALEKDRERRYASVRELREDIERHLADEPIRARPPSPAYVTAKFVRRHRAGVTVAAALVFAALLGVAGVVAGLLQARAAAEQARREAAVATRVTDLMAGMFELSAPERALGREPTVREALDAGVDRIRRELVEAPEVQARLLAAVGRVHEGLGSLDEAERELDEALRLQRRELGEDSRTTLSTQLAHARVLRQLARHTEAERSLATLVTALRRTEGPTSPRTAEAMIEHARVLRELDREAEGEALVRRAGETLRRELGEQDPLVLDARLELARALAARDEHELAAREAAFVLAAREPRLPAAHPRILEARNVLADSSSNMARHELAIELHERTLVELERIYDAQHPAVAHTLVDLAEAHHRADSLNEAEELYRRAVELMRANGLAVHPITALAQADLAALLFYRACHEEAEELSRTAIESYAQLFGPQHYSTVVNQGLLVEILRGRGRFEEAAEVNELVCAGWKRAHPELHWQTVACPRSLAALWMQAGRPERARAALDEYVALTQLRLGDEHPEEAFARGLRHSWLGEHDRALDCLEQAVARGYSSAQTLSEDAAFASLQDEPRFRQLLVSLGEPSSR